MRTLNILAVPVFVAGLAMAASANAAAERHYDCTKPGNANKAECKAAAKPAMAPTPVAAAKPAPSAKPMPAPAPPAASAAATTSTTHRSRARTTTPAAPGTERPRSAAQLANDAKMRACGAKWQALATGDKAKWDAKGAAKKDKNGKPETGWITYSVDCRKGRA